MKSFEDFLWGVLQRGYAIVAGPRPLTPEQCRIGDTGPFDREEPHPFETFVRDGKLGDRCIWCGHDGQDRVHG